MSYLILKYKKNRTRIFADYADAKNGFLYRFQRYDFRHLHLNHPLFIGEISLFQIRQYHLNQRKSAMLFF